MIHNERISPCTFSETSDFTSQTDFDSFFSDQAVQTPNDILHESSSPQNSSERGATADFTAQTNFDFLFSDQAIQTIDDALCDNFDDAAMIRCICTTNVAKGKRKFKQLQGPKPKKVCTHSNTIPTTRQKAHPIASTTCLRTACSNWSRHAILAGATKTPPRALSTKKSCSSISVQTDCHHAVALVTHTHHDSFSSASTGMQTATGIHIHNAATSNVPTGMQTIQPLTSPMSVQTDCHYQMGTATGIQTHNAATSSVSTGMQTIQPLTSPMSVQTDYSYGTGFCSASTASSLQIPLPVPSVRTMPRWDATGRL